MTTEELLGLCKDGKPHDFRQKFSGAIICDRCELEATGLGDVRSFTPAAAERAAAAKRPADHEGLS